MNEYIKKEILNLLFVTLRRKYNKVYFREIESVFEKMKTLDLSSQELQSLKYLAHDVSIEKKKKEFF